MKLHSRRTIEYVSVFALLLLAVVLWFALQRSGQIQTSIDTGRFEAGYASAMDALRTRTRELREKLSGGDPGPLVISAEKQEPQKLKDEPETVDGAKANEPRTIKLRGIYWSETMPLADINGTLRKPGEKFAGFVLEEIQPYLIILTDPDGNSITNYLLGKKLFEIQQQQLPAEQL